MWCFPMSDRPAAPTPGSEQLQSAARAVIDAARALLDMAEGLIADPSAIQSMFSSVRDIAREGFASFASMTGEPASAESEHIDVREGSLDDD